MSVTKPLIELNENLNKDEEASAGVSVARNHVKELSSNCETGTPDDEASANSNDSSENVDKETKSEDLENNVDEVFNENDPEFIGAKLPPVMTQAEVKAFSDKLMAELFPR